MRYEVTYRKNKSFEVTRVETIEEANALAKKLQDLGVESISIASDNDLTVSYGRHSISECCSKLQGEFCGDNLHITKDHKKLAEKIINAPRGSIFVIIAPSGGGKTSILKYIEERIYEHMYDLYDEWPQACEKLPFVSVIKNSSSEKLLEFAAHPDLSETLICYNRSRGKYFFTENLDEAGIKSDAAEGAAWSSYTGKFNRDGERYPIDKKLISGIMRENLIRVPFVIRDMRDYGATQFSKMNRDLDELLQLWNERAELNEETAAPHCVMIITVQEEMLERHRGHYFIKKGIPIRLQPWKSEDLKALIPDWEDAGIDNDAMEYLATPSAPRDFKRRIQAVIELAENADEEAREQHPFEYQPKARITLEMAREAVGNIFDPMPGTAGIFQDPDYKKDADSIMAKLAGGHCHQGEIAALFQDRKNDPEVHASRLLKKLHKHNLVMFVKDEGDSRRKIWSLRSSYGACN